MATLFQAIAIHGPRLTYNPTIELDDVARWLSLRTGTPVYPIALTLHELGAALHHFSRTGTPIRIPGIGRLRPTMDRSGTIRLNGAADPAVVRALNAPGAYTAPIVNAANIGLDDAGYKRLWDVGHPDDPLKLGRLSAR